MFEPGRPPWGVTLGARGRYDTALRGTAVTSFREEKDAT